ncbi:MAG: histidinol-phosphatase HisJ family protein [Clostridia bacterium]|nr:histidinol-phosphatase HisJ family protein [Clostridia bacterium]
MDNALIADMHTHSEYSHDSVCTIEDMCLSQIEKGTKIFAVTDHCDVFYSNDFDIYTPIKNAYDNVKALNKKYGDKCIILSGVEISEGFWYPKACEKIHGLLPYDVIIGSVHCVKCKGLEDPYAKLDFSKVSKERLHEFLDCYFNDMITMLEYMNFDILAHLTCPLRYIIGKYGLNIDISIFKDRILNILKLIIEKNIALEVNTSYIVLNDFIPNKEILKKYYKMGGRLITLGSDAHIAQNASANFEAAIKVLKEIGFKDICYFKNRKLNKISI